MRLERAAARIAPLALLLVVAAAPARRGGATNIVVGGPPGLGRESSRLGQPMDWDAIRARTQRFEKLKAEHDVLSEDRRYTPQLGGLLEELRTSIGPAPSLGRRLAFPREAGATERASCSRAVSALHEATKSLGRDFERAKLDLDVLESQRLTKTGGPRFAAVIEGDRKALVARFAETTSLLARVEAGLALRTGSFWARTALYGRQLIWRDPATAMAGLEERLGEWGALRPPPVLSAELTYVQGALRGGALPTTNIVPAYASAASDFTLEDTTQGREVELSADVQARAASLGSAKAAHDFVRNELRLDWYYGCQKGTTETLRSMRGNDADLSALLIALLRAQGVPARYVQGTIELPVARLAELMGLLDASDVDALDGGGLSSTRLDSVRNLVLAGLGGAGVPYEPVVSGGRVSSVRFVHTWVEAFLSYDSYRGIGAGSALRQWVPLDPAIHGRGRYAAAPGVLDGYAAAALSAGSVVAQYLSAPTADSPLEAVQRRVRDYLSANRPDVTYEQATRRVLSRAESLPFIPGSLPFKVISVQGEYAFLPEGAKHKARITVADATGALVDVTLPLHQLSGHRTVLAYKPATDADADAVALAGGLYAAPAATVQVVPVIRVDGAERAVASRAVGLGEEHTWTIELQLPDGSARRIDNRIIAGNLVAVGFGSPGNGYIETPPADGSDLDGPAPRFLYARAAAYARLWTQAEEEFAALIRVVPMRPTANVVLVDNQLDVDQVLGVRRRLLWKGLEVDADHRSMLPLELVPGRAKELLRLSGYEGSYLESRVLLDGTGEESISAVQVLQQASAQGIPVVTLTKASTADALAGLAVTAEVLSDVKDQLAQGREVMIPIASVSVRDWVGTGFIARDAETEEGGYFLSGHVSGGQTVVSPESWTDQDLVAQLEQPEAPPATRDTSLVARIVKVASTDMQQGVVGKALKRPLEVFVTTAKGVPVAGATVTFRTMEASRPSFFDAATTTMQDGQLTVTTDSRGRAGVVTTPDTSIGSFAILSTGVPNDQLVGLDVVTAQTVDASGNTIILADPFHEVGLPDAPAKLKQLPETAFQAPYQMILGLDLPVYVQDKWGNAIANAEVTWTQTPDTGAFVDPALRPKDRVALLDPRDLSQKVTLTQVSSTLGTVVVDYINGGATHLVTATVLGAPPASYTVESYSDTGTDWVFGYVPNARTSWDGVYGTSYPEPFVFQILRRGEQGEPAWVSISGDDTAYSLVSVNMAVTDGVNPVAGAGAQASPMKTDGAVKATLWPRYVVKDGTENLIFTAEVWQGGTKKCCDANYVFAMRSATVTVQVDREIPGGLLVPAGLGGSQLGDVALDFTIRNPGSEPIYARLSQSPAVASEQLLETPPPDVAPRHPLHPDWLRLEPFATTRLSFHRASSHGGLVNLEVLAPDTSVGSDTVAIAANVGAIVSTASIVIEQPPDVMSFLVQGNRVLDAIRARLDLATADGANAFWTVTPSAATSGYTAPNGNAGNPFTFVPTLPAHYNYKKGNNSCSTCAAKWWVDAGGTADTNCGNGCRSQMASSLSYAVEVNAGAATAIAVVTQDEIDTIRQEYINHGLTEMCPGRDLFRAAQATEHYSSSDLNNTVYSRVPGDPGLLAERILLSFNQALSRDVQLVALGTRAASSSTIIVGPGLDVVVGVDGSGNDILRGVVTTPTCYPDPPDTCDDYYLVDANGLPVGIAAGDDRVVNTRVRVMPSGGSGMAKPAIASGWRNPERNEAVGGELGSTHQVGDALDLVPNADAFPGGQGLLPAIGWCVLLQAASLPDVYAQAEQPGSTLSVPCVAASVNHVHVNLER